MADSTGVRIHRLRRRLQALGTPLAVENLWGAGFRLSAPVEIEPPYIPERTVPLPASAMQPLRELLRRCAKRTADAHLAERVRAEIRHAQEATA